MNYINKGKRDILIFPQFSNIEKIQNIRKKYDELADILPPHITLAYPFKSNLSNNEIKDKLKEILKERKSFRVKFKGISIYKDTKVNNNYIFLDIVDGYEEVMEIHKKIYNYVLKIDQPKIFVPHITLGSIKEENINIELNDEFECIVDKIYLESIGENEESNIEFEVFLNR